MNSNSQISSIIMCSSYLRIQNYGLNYARILIFSSNPVQQQIISPYGILKNLSNIVRETRSNEKFDFRFFIFFFLTSALSKVKES